MDHVRIAFAANLNRSADTLERLAATLTTADPTKQEHLEEMQAQVDAGAVIWGAVLQGFLTTPEILNIGLAEGEVDTATGEGVECANLFFSVMREFVYPLGEAVVPRSLCEESEWAMTDDKRAVMRKRELQNEATGCRILAKLIETPENEVIEDKKRDTEKTSPRPLRPLNDESRACIRLYNQQARADGKKPNMRAICEQYARENGGSFDSIYRTVKDHRAEWKGTRKGTK
jgi:hypothetical protein